MKICIFSQSQDLYSTKRLIEACRQQNHEPVVADPLSCILKSGKNGLEIFHQNQILSDSDVVIPRISSSLTSTGISVLRHLEMMNIFCLNSSSAILRSRDKFFCTQTLCAQKIPVPATVFSSQFSNANDLLDLIGNPPFIFKLLCGTQGMGVVLVYNLESAQGIMDSFRTLKADFLIQEFISEAEGKDLRCFVVNFEVVASMLRISKNGEFRSNLHRGGIGQKVIISKEEREIAINAAKAMNLRVCGVDILRSSRGPLVMEVNSSPGLNGIEKITGEDIAQKIIMAMKKLYASQ